MPCLRRHVSPRKRFIRSFVSHRSNSFRATFRFIFLRPFILDTFYSLNPSFQLEKVWSLEFIQNETLIDSNGLSGFLTSFAPKSDEVVWKVLVAYQENLLTCQLMT